MSADYEVYTVIDATNKDSKNFWCRIGAGWENKDGSINVRLNALPVNASIHIRRPREEEDNKKGSKR